MSKVSKKNLCESCMKSMADGSKPDEEPLNSSKPMGGGEKVPASDSKGSKEGLKKALAKKYKGK